MIGLSSDEIRKWPHLPKIELIDKLAEVTAELFGAHQVHSINLVEERRVKVNAYARSDQGSVTGRDREASAAGLAATLSVLETEGEIAALSLARELLLELIHQEM